METRTIAPHGDAILKPLLPLPLRLSTDGLLRTKSDITSQFSKDMIDEAAAELSPLPAISEACKCCGMCEEYTSEYIDKVRTRYLGKWIYGLCAEAVKEEMERQGERAASQRRRRCGRT